MLTESCNWGWAACGCGVAIRAGRDVFVVSHCSGDHIIEFLNYDDGILEARQRSTNRYNVSPSSVSYLPSDTIFVNISNTM